MTETPPPQDQQPRSGVDTGNLRSYERLRRSTTDRKIAGVAGGLGRHLNIDPTVLRVLFVVLTLFGGAGLVLYGAMWLIVPEEGREDGVINTTPSTRNALLIVAGVVTALVLLSDSVGDMGFPWPLALIALVVLLVFANRDRPGRAPATTTPSAVPGSPEGPTTWAAPVTAAAAPGPRRDRGPRLFGATLAAVAVALGSLGLYEASGGTVVDAAYPALALAVVGAMLVVGAFAGRPGGLILLGIIAALALGITSTVDGNWNRDTRIAETPLTAARLSDGYSVTAGRIQLDLTQVRDLQNLDGRRLAVDAEAGEIVVIVPDGVDVDVDASIRFGGEVEVDGYVENGNRVDVNRQIDGGDDVPQIDLELDLLVGHIEVRQEGTA